MRAAEARADDVALQGDEARTNTVDRTGQTELRKLRKTVRNLVLVVAASALFFGGIAAITKDEELGRFVVTGQRTVTIFAEPEFHYEPPGYVYCRVTDGHKILIPRRRFRSVGPERVPYGKFSVVTDRAGNLFAITLDNNVEFLHDVRARRTWPGQHAETDQPAAAFAREALEHLASEGAMLRCSRLVEYEATRRITAVRNPAQTEGR